MRTVKLNDIRIDGGTQGRVVIDQNHVYHMVEMMKEGYEFDPIDTNFDGATYWLVDGFHRYHAYKLMGIKEVTIKYVPGTQEEAVIRSYGVNAKHGLPRSFDDKKKVVEEALANPLLKDKSNYEIAKICVVSQSFVAGVKDPEKKKKQKEAKERHIKKKAEEITSQTSTPDTTSQTSSEKATPVAPVDPNAGAAPDEDELKANELAVQADMETMYKLLESDDALATAHEEIKRLNHLNAQLEVRLHGLMNERNEAVKMVKKLQKENDKLKGKK
ncbi:parB-like nuclease domain [Caudoviricetes sp.]|nr:parB-like nuclease domain [Caudoviricetes sp.]